MVIIIFFKKNHFNSMIVFRSVQMSDVSVSRVTGTTTPVDHVTPRRQTCSSQGNHRGCLTQPCRIREMDTDRQHGHGNIEAHDKYTRQNRFPPLNAYLTRPRRHYNSQSSPSGIWAQRLSSHHVGCQSMEAAPTGRLI